MSVAVAEVELVRYQPPPVASLFVLSSLRLTRSASHFTVVSGLLLLMFMKCADVVFFSSGVSSKTTSVTRAEV